MSVNSTAMNGGRAVTVPKSIFSTMIPAATAQRDHDRRHHHACHAQLAVPVGPAGADQQHLCRQQHQPTDKNGCMEVYDQRVGLAVFQVLEVDRTKSHQDAEPDQPHEDKERIAVPFVVGGEAQADVKGRDPRLSQLSWRYPLP